MVRNIVNLPLVVVEIWIYFNIKLWFIVIRYLMTSSWRHNSCFIYLLSSKYMPSNVANYGFLFRKILRQNSHPCLTRDCILYTVYYMCTCNSVRRVTRLKTTASCCMCARTDDYVYTNNVWGKAVCVPVYCILYTTCAHVIQFAVWPDLRLLHRAVCVRAQTIMFTQTMCGERPFACGTVLAEYSFT